jgi:putative protease
MAGHRFGARAFAENFTEADLKEAIDYAHLRGVSVFIVVNTLMFDDEISEVIKYTDELVKNNIDALIVQDIGLIKIFCERYPNTAIHASTQVNAHNLNHVLFLKSLGVKRVILARETSLDVIKAIKATVDIELEVFIHGALCVSFSGNCLISSIINKRSGNRGECAYNCRLPYKLVKETEVIAEESYLMSAKDLMTLEYLEDLIEAGVDSFKIEGRMRKKEYVTQTVLSYKKAIDAYFAGRKIDKTAEIDKLKRVFNRDYTKGYMFNEVPKELNNDFRPNHMGVEIGKVLSYTNNLAEIHLNEDLRNGDGFRIVGSHDYGNTVTFMQRKNGTIIKEAYKGETIFLEVKETVFKDSLLFKTTDSTLEKELIIYQNPNYKIVPLKAFLKVFVGSPIEIDLTDDQGHYIHLESDYVVEQFKTTPLDETTIQTQFLKFGDTPYFFEELSIYTDHISFVPVKMFNEFRRMLIEQLNSTRTERDSRIIETHNHIENGFIYDDQERLVVKVHTKEQLEVAIESNIETIYYDDLIDIKDFNHPNLIPATKRILEDIKDYHIDGLTLVNELGGIYLGQGKYPIITDEFVNVTNIHTAALLSTKGVLRISLSSELDKDHILAFSSAYHQYYQGYPNLEMVLYGHKDLMISKYCPVAKTFDYKPNCKLCFKNQYYIQDHTTGKFALLNDGNCNMRIMDPMPLLLIDQIEALRRANIKTFRLDFTTESKTKMKSIIKSFKQALDQKPYKIELDRYRTGRFI